MTGIDPTAFVVHKFGGTSVGDAERIRAVAHLVESLGDARIAVVVSAMSKVTDALFAACQSAAARDDGWRSTLAALRARHASTAAALLESASAQRFIAALDADLREIEHLLAALGVLGSRSEAIEEVVAGHGEVWSAQLLAGALGVPWMDARRTLVVRGAEGGPVVDEPESRTRTARFVDECRSARFVITGYVASTPEGTATTLKRNGSDFSASIFGALLDAREVVIWTDVDGVLSADPRRVPDAVVVPEMSYAEAMELAYFGAKVVHPRTMQPAVKRGIPIRIKNTFRPEVPGTLIHAHAPRDPARPVKGFSTIDEIALLNVEGTGMVGVPGVAERLFGALRAVGVSVIVISQASSEHSICFAVPRAQAARARVTVERAFAAELADGSLSSVDVRDDCAVLAAVGDAMAQQTGVAARFFGALADANVNVVAVAQGSSERNITAVVAAPQAVRALRAVHARFMLSLHTLSLGVVGPGLIGQALLTQLAAQRADLRERARLDLRVRAIASTRRMVLGEDVSAAAFQASDAACDLDTFAHHVQADHIPHAVIVDCTASDDVASRYAGWLARGIHVVTPNKRAASGDGARWRAILEAGTAGRSRYLGEATVGAGLPLITTLRELIHTGDEVRSVEGVLSGTLSWIFNTLTPDIPFSALVREAKALGYTEPDPREDLSGTDFARKLVVLARQMGRAVELADVEVEDLAPGVPAGLPLDELVAALRPVDEALRARLVAAQERGRVLRFVGSIPAHGPPRVALTELALGHPFARLHGTDNVVAFHTRRYDAQPLIVQGPGAGPEVTAGGVFGDLLRLAAHLGADV